MIAQTRALHSHIDPCKLLFVNIPPCDAALQQTMRLQMVSDAPHQAYFRDKEGRWRGKIRFELTDSRGLRESRLSLADKWSLRSLSFASRLSALVLNTTVDFGSRGRHYEVLHTTRVSNMGIPVYRSAETIFLEADGRSFRIEGREAYFPFLRPANWGASGAVAMDYDGATYLIPFLGMTMEQETRMTAAGLEISQVTEFSRATILLKLQRPLWTGRSSKEAGSSKG